MPTAEIVQAAMNRRTERTRDAIADLLEGRNTVKEVAHRLGVTAWAVYRMRRRFEISAQSVLPRHETRGSKLGRPKPRSLFLHQPVNETSPPVNAVA